MKLICQVLVFVILLSSPILTFGAHYSGYIEGYYGGYCYVDGDYRIIRTYSDFYVDVYDRSTYTCSNFSIIPSIVLSGTVTEEYSDDPDYDHIIYNATLTINGEPFNIDADIYEDWEAYNISGTLKINGQEYSVTWELADILWSLVY